jgi:hypothetical protein
MHSEDTGWPDQEFAEEQTEELEENISVKDLSRLADEAFELDLEIKAKEAEIKERTKALTNLKFKILRVLEQNDLQNFKCSHGLFYKQKEVSIPLPKGPDRDAFFEYLKQTGQYDALITLNSRTVNSWYKKERENAEKEKRLLIIPGLQSPTETWVPRMKRG